MNSQKKIAIVYFLAVALLGLAAVMLFRVVILKDFVKLEQQTAVTRLDGGYKLLESEAARLVQVLKDYAAWAHTCKFIRELNEEYRKENLRPEVFNDLDINFMAFLDPDGNWREGAYYDEKKSAMVPFPSDLKNHIVARQKLWKNLKIGKNITGFIRPQNQLYIIGVSPVTTEDREGPIHGFMLMGRIIGPVQITHYSTMLHQDVQLEAYPNAEWPNIKNTMIKVVNANKITLARPIYDIDAQPIMILMFSEERSIYQNALTAVQRFMLWYLFSAIILFVVIYVFLQYSFFAPIKDASRKLSRFINKLPENHSATNSELDRDPIPALLEMAKKTAVALEQESANREKLISDIPVGVLIVDAKFTIREANRMALKICGYDSAVDLVGKDCCDVFCHDLPCRLRAGTVPDNDYEETYLYHRDGRKIPVLKTYSQIKINDESLYFESFIDLSEAGEAAAHLSGYHRRLEKMINDLQAMNQILHKELGSHRETQNSLLKAKDDAVTSDRLKAAFLSNVSDAIRTPLTSLMGFAGLLQEENISLEEQRHHLKAISDSSACLLDVMNTIIDVAKLESGTAVLRHEPIAINKMMSSFFECASTKYKNRQDVIFRLVPPSPFEEMTVIGDVEWLERAMWQLLDNAFKFTRMGRIEIGFRRESENSMRLFVSDTGIGIEPERQKAIFDMFNQTEDFPSRHYSGIGLGLTICVRVAALMNGLLEVESETGKGTTFYFILPLNKPGA